MANFINNLKKNLYKNIDIYLLKIYLYLKIVYRESIV